MVNKHTPFNNIRWGRIISEPYAGGRESGDIGINRSPHPDKYPADVNIAYSMIVGSGGKKFKIGCSMTMTINEESIDTAPHLMAVAYADMIIETVPGALSQLGITAAVTERNLLIRKLTKIIELGAGAGN